VPHRYGTVAVTVAAGARPSLPWRAVETPAHVGERWVDDAALIAAQQRVAAAAPPSWVPPPRPADTDSPASGLVAVGCFVAYLRGEQGPGHAGDRAWVGVAAWSEERGPLGAAAVRGRAEAAYAPGLLARREAPMLVDALGPFVTGLAASPVLLVDATGRDHPRRAGLALHVGALLDVPTVGITHRPLVGDRNCPRLTRGGDWAPIVLDGETVAAWVCTSQGSRPVVAHAGWRTDAEAAVAVAVRTSAGARTPEPLRLARQAARNARSADDASAVLGVQTVTTAGGPDGGR
jgi:deoxyribonuclease V